MSHSIHPIALFRLAVLGPLASRDKLSHGELQRYLRELAQQTYQIPGSRRVHLSEKTIERWYYAWRKNGIDALSPNQRSDKGQCQLPEDVQTAIIALKKDNPQRSINTIIQLLELDGKVAKNQLARATVHRLLHHQHISKRLALNPRIIERRAFEAQFTGDIGYGDVMYQVSTIFAGWRQLSLPVSNR
jgi:transposase